MTARLRTAVAALAALLALALPSGPPPLAQPVAEGLTVMRSDFGVAETLDRLEQALTDKGLTVFGRIDHGANARDAGLDLMPAQVLLFGNPKLGTPLMQASPTAAIDLPQKALAWQDADGTVWLATNDPAWLAERHGIAGRDEVLETIGTALRTLTTRAAAAQ